MRVSLRAEIAALKGVKGRPAIQPSGMERKTEPKPEGSDSRRGKKRRKTERLVIHEDRIIKAEPYRVYRRLVWLSHAAKVTLSICP
jgi:hypothetical protein